MDRTNKSSSSSGVHSEFSDNCWDERTKLDCKVLSCCDFLPSFGLIFGRETSFVPLSFFPSVAVVDPIVCLVSGFGFPESGAWSRRRTNSGS